MADVFTVPSEIATIVTLFVAAFAYMRYLVRLRYNRNALEDYLKKEKTNALAAYQKKDPKSRSVRPPQGLRSILQISRALALTSDEIIQASFGNKSICRRVRLNRGTRIAETLLLGIEPCDGPPEVESMDVEAHV